MQVIIVTINSWGAIYEWCGARPIYLSAFFLCGTATALYPVTSSLITLTAARCLFSVGAAGLATMISTVLAAYVSSQRKGMGASYTSLASGVGALVAALFFLNIPKQLVSGRFSEHDAQLLTFGGVGCFALIAGVVACLGTTTSTRAHGATKTPSADSHAAAAAVAACPHLQTLHTDAGAPLPVVPVPSSGVFSRLKTCGLSYTNGFTYARHDKRLLLSYLSGMAARGDSSVLTVFLSLWITTYVKNLGGSDSEGSKQAGMITGIAQTVALICALVFGKVCDRLNRSLSAAVLAAIAAGGYAFMACLTVPNGTSAYIAACLVGAGEMGAIVSSQALVCDAAPEEARGAVGATFGLFGSLGVLLAAVVGGALYDSNPAGPFMFFAALNTVVVFYALYVYFTFDRPRQVAATSASRHGDVVSYKVFTDEESATCDPPLDSMDLSTPARA
jgi:MFS family permease